MFKMILNGYLGVMGGVIRAIQTGEHEIVAGADVMPPGSAMPFPTYVNISDCDMPADVILDFSTASAVPNVLRYAEKRRVPVVICTTGLSDATVEQLNECAKSVAVFHSANMSLGINLLASVVRKAALALSGFDVEIVEKHHNKKIDAPSGTAMLLAESINDALDEKLSYVYDRTASRERRGENQIGIHSVRCGSVVGEHTVIFAGANEVLEFTHIAQSKEVFARGALRAAKYVKDKPPGLYAMRDIIEEL
ncbi:MAG: 4-hydroxy-tetrahydrodipicolinate reductase [Clostridiales bacterium]|jgi:4-hydroxy-tetrahydrodipicolinate reductase|nr:4-hydroxy-tetrahydrodipicolinate reductase [Clostridiales bacterium]